MPRGGQRQGAGRPKGQGLYGEPTETLRVPQSMVADIKQFAQTKGYRIPLFSCAVQAGTPTTADDHVQDFVELNQLLLDDPANNFMVRVAGDSMIDAGIEDGDLLIANRTAKPQNGKIVIAAVDGELTVKYLVLKKDQSILMPGNQAFSPIPINPETGATILGVVTRSIKAH